jgi:predicted secreted protein with PEFG-CTERM motif
MLSGTCYANATVSNGALTENDIELCHEIYPQYKTLGLSWFLENYHYSIEARVCASLYEDQIWQYKGDDRMQKLIERSKYFVKLEIEESENEAKSGQIDPTPAGIFEKLNSITKISSDGTIIVKIETTDATPGEYMGINVIFKDLEDKLVKHVNYDLRVTQNQKEFLVVQSQHAETGMVEHWTRPLFSDAPVDVEITILGIGLPKDRGNWTGPSDELLTFNAVPEFGILTLAILTISIMPIIILVQKSKLLQKL